MNVFTIITAIISIITLIAVIYQSISMRITVENQIYQSFINNSIELSQQHTRDRKIQSFLLLAASIFGGVLT